MHCVISQDGLLPFSARIAAFTKNELPKNTFLVEALYDPTQPAHQ